MPLCRQGQVFKVAPGKDDEETLCQALENA